MTGPRCREPPGSCTPAATSCVPGPAARLAALTDLLHAGQRAPHRKPSARAVIMLMQNGGPSQMDLFDPKPELQKRDGQDPRHSVEMFQKGSEANMLLASPFRFRRRGQCGMELSEVLPHLGAVADDICLVRSMYTEHNNHTEALVMLNTGKIFPGRPALGSWVSYALGTENQNLPAYVVLRDPDGYNTSGTLLWSERLAAGRSTGAPSSAPRGAPVLEPAPGRARLARGAQRDDLDFLARAERGAPPAATRARSELEARIRNYELAARMQLGGRRGARPVARDGGDPQAVRPGQPGDRRLRHCAA